MADFVADAEAILSAEDFLAGFAGRDLEQTTNILVSRLTSEDGASGGMRFVYALALLSDFAIQQAALVNGVQRDLYLRELAKLVLRHLSDREEADHG